MPLLAKHSLNALFRVFESRIFPTRIRGVDFVGYRFFGDFILLRKAIAKAIKRKVRYFHKAEPKPSHLNSFYSYLGFLAPANTRRFYAKYMYDLDFLYRWLLNKDYKRFKIATNTRFYFMFCNVCKAIKFSTFLSINRAPLLELVLLGVLFTASVKTLHLALLFQLLPVLAILSP